MTSTPALLELEQISFTYPGARHPVLENIDFSLREGQKIGLIGTNGSGKTTLFHIIMGLLTPTAGRLFFQGRELQQKRDFLALRRTIGLLFQDADDQLFSPTVIEDVAFGPLNLGATPGEARRRAEKTLSELGLTHLKERITHQLSGGEKKLVSLATILVMEPRALLLDEPTNNLDAETRTRLIEILEGLDLAYILISHDWDFLAHTSREIFAIDKGHLLRSENIYFHNHRHFHPCGDIPHKHGGQPHPHDHEHNHEHQHGHPEETRPEREEKQKS